ncbi:carbohydrate ABC transporter permease [Puerhibacterium sp. TATVAM-FAB25]|uniref:carbohydrate ABC transporter permease n=1 Tax=Puerhibacterium sp. TATVAM-FAB25 TaxID=3093699 RepID=UPI00397A7597
MVPFVIPLILVVRTSLRGEGLGNYAAVLTESPFFRFLTNSAVIAAGSVLAVYALTMLAGYAFAKLRFPGRTVLFNALLVGLMVPTVALLVPLFVTVQRLGLFNSYAAVIVPLTATIVPFTLLLVRNYMAGLPDEILEAARIDGCSTLGTLWRVVLPLSRPISAVVVVWSFLNSWNEFFLPLIFLQDPGKQAITQVPLYFASQYGSDIPKIFAAVVLISLPVVLAYLFLQRYFERGMTAGAVK